MNAGVHRRWRDSQLHIAYPERRLVHGAVRDCAGALRRRIPRAPPICAQSALGGLRQCGWPLFHTFALAGTSSQAPRRVSTGTCRASCDAGAASCPRVCLLGVRHLWASASRRVCRKTHGCERGRRRRSLPRKAMLQCLDCLACRWHRRCRWIGRDLGMSRWQLSATLYFFAVSGNVGGKAR
jgi:hypothetical protein